MMTSLPWTIDLLFTCILATTFPHAKSAANQHSGSRSFTKMDQLVIIAAWSTTRKIVQDLTDLPNKLDVLPLRSPHQYYIFDRTALSQIPVQSRDNDLRHKSSPAHSRLFHRLGSGQRGSVIEQPLESVFYHADRAKIIRAIRNDRIHSKRAMIGADQMVAGGLGCRIRRIGMIGASFCECPRLSRVPYTSSVETWWKRAPTGHFVPILAAFFQ
jgi:hypothetical protein